MDYGSPKAGSTEGDVMMKTVLVLAGIIVLGVLFFLAELGVVPGLSDALGTREADTLGVQYGTRDLETLKAAYQSARSGVGRESSSPPENQGPGEARQAQGPRLVVSNAQLSAWLNARNLKGLPLKNIHARSLLESLEISGTLDKAKVADFAQLVGRKDPKIRGVIEQLGDLDGTPVYLRFSGGVESGKLSAHLESVRLGALPLPAAVLQRLSEKEIRATTLDQGSFSIEQLHFEEDRLSFEGLLPEALMLPAP